MAFLESLLTKINAKDFGRHLLSYTDLYIRPLKIWRQVLNNRTTSIDLLAIHIIYYFIFSFVFFGLPIRYTVIYVFAEVTLTIIPFIIFIIPFKIFTRAFKKKIKANRLFRLFVILKLQFLPLIILLFKFGTWADTEFQYVIVDNLVFLFLMELVLILPLIIHLRFWQRAAWIASNYFFFFLYMLAVVYLIPKVIPPSWDRKVSVSTPDLEYLTFKAELINTFLQINDRYYLVVLHNVKDGERLSGNSQFVTNEVLLLFHSIGYKRSTKQLAILKAAKTNPDSIPESSLGYALAKHPKVEASSKSFDTLRWAFTKHFNSSVSLLKRLKDSAVFTSNRKYFLAQYDYLKKYEHSYLDTTENEKLDLDFKKAEWENLADNSVIILYKTDSSYYLPEKRAYLKLQTELDERSAQSHFVISILFYPIDKVLDYFGLYD